MNNDINYCYRCKLEKEWCAASISPSENGTKYTIMPGYGSEFDNVRMQFIGRFKNQDEFRFKFKWIAELNPIKDILCDDCIKEMIFAKEVRIVDEGIGDNVIYRPFYTSCCDTLVLEYNQKDNQNTFSSDSPCFYRLIKLDKFPYASEFAINSEWIDYNTPSLRKYCDDIFPDYEVNCVYCHNCLEKYLPFLRDNSYYLSRLGDHPLDGNIDDLRNQIQIWQDHYRMEIYGGYNGDETFEHVRTLEFRLKMKEYHIELIKELEQYFFTSNLEIICQKYYLPKDIKRYLLKFI